MSIDIDWSLLGSRRRASTSDPIHSPPLSPRIEISPDEPDTLTANLIASLNTHLASASRPSFIGPISIASFDFGVAGPSVEIKDIRDVWRAFDEGDEDDYGEQDASGWEQGEHSGYENGDGRFWDESRGWDDSGEYGGSRERSFDSSFEQPRVRGQDDPFREPRRNPRHPLGSRSGPEGDWRDSDELEVLDGEMVEEEDGEMDDSMSVISGVSPRHNLSAVGMGFGLASGPGSPRTMAMGLGMGLGAGGGAGARGLSSGVSDPRLSRYLSQDRLPGGSHAHAHARAQSLISAPLRNGMAQHPGSRSPQTRYRQLYDDRRDPHAHAHPASFRPTHRPSHSTTRQILRPTPPGTPPPSPPARPRGLGHRPGDPSPNHSTSSLPSLQLHLHIKHTSDIHLTLLTSLQVNYPSQIFMSLPLKLSITGISLEADLVLAYSARHRVHVCLADPDAPQSTQSHSHGGYAAQPFGRDHHAASAVDIGKKILPHIHIESEIGHADVHALRNVGKVERFIADAIRKTVVDELVFPNFHTIVL